MCGVGRPAHNGVVLRIPTELASVEVGLSTTRDEQDLPAYTTGLVRVLRKSGNAPGLPWGWLRSMLPPGIQKDSDAAGLPGGVSRSLLVKSDRSHLRNDPPVGPVACPSRFDRLR